MTQKALRVSIYIYILYILYIYYIYYIYIYIILWTLYIYIYIEYKDQHSKSFYQGVSTANLTNNRKLNQTLDIFILLF